MYFEQFTTPVLGCYSYLIGCAEAGVCAVVDPRRDIDVYLAVSRATKMKITHIIDTHLHADHISGARELSQVTGAPIYMHEDAPMEFPFHKVKHGDRLEVGVALFTALHTPGHTPNSLSLVISDLTRSPEPQMILTGDLLFVGDTGRPDLPGELILNKQVKDLFDSLYEVLGPLPDRLELYPAHGQGSLCGGGLSAKPYSTLGYERIANPKLQFKEFDKFSDNILSQTPIRPQSFSYIIETNRQGPPMRPSNAGMPALTLEEFDAFRDKGAIVLDLRKDLSYSAAHIPGSFHVDAYQGQSLNWIGTIIPPKSTLLLVLEQDDEFPQRRKELQSIGYEDIAGWLNGGMSTWVLAGRKVAQMPFVSAKDLRQKMADNEPLVIVDVRAKQEFDDGHIPGSHHVPFQTLLADGYKFDATKEIVINCRTAHRSFIAASYIVNHYPGLNVSVLGGGMIAYDKSQFDKVIA